jgi:hypothetical protein
MKKYVKIPHQGDHYGIWIDRSRALLCRRDRNGFFISQDIPSGVETHPRFHGEGTDKTGMMGRTINRQKKDQGHIEHDTHQFLRKVAEFIIEPAHVTILGSGDLRFELQKELERRKEFKGIPLENRASEKITMQELMGMMEHEPAF